MPAIENRTTPITTLSKRVTMIWGLSLHGWEDVMRFSLAIVGVFGLIVGLSTWFVVKLQRFEIEQSKIELEQYKSDAAVKVEEAKNEGVEAGKAAGSALVRAAELEKEAANAKLETEQLKQVVAWRVLSPEVAAGLEKLLSAKPGSVNLRFMDGDPEALFLAIQISKILEKAKWQIAPGAVKPPNSIYVGLGLPNSSGTDAQTLRDAFSSLKIPFSTEAPAEGVAFSISTIPGAPMLMVGSKAPPQLQ